MTPLSILPELTPIQFLTLNLLFVGPQTGSQLRSILEKFGAGRSPSAFCKLMLQMVARNLVADEFVFERSGCSLVREKVFTVTDFGVMQWIETQKFYQELAPPSADLVPESTDAPKAAVYGKAVVENEWKREVKSLLRNLQREIDDGASSGCARLSSANSSTTAENPLPEL
jgi:hypothetical protein